MLENAELIAFLPTRDPHRARQFYEQVLGLEFLREEPAALVFNANGVMLRIANVSSVAEFRPAAFTVLGWRVQSVEKCVRELGSRGIRFERFTGMEQDELGIWRSPGGARVAWLRDPDGNVLSVTEFEQGKR